jgi:hypothetical protein
MDISKVQEENMIYINEREFAIDGDTDSIFVSDTSNAAHNHNLPVVAFTAACKQN